MKKFIFLILISFLPVIAKSQQPGPGTISILMKQFIGYLSHELGPDVKLTCTQEEIILAIQKKHNISRTETAEIIEEIQTMLDNVEKGLMTPTACLREITSCKGRCGVVLGEIADCYITAMRKYYRGIVFFNIGISEISGSFLGDASQGHMQINNDPTLNKALTELKTDPNAKIILEARASLPGNSDDNETLTKMRVNAVANWFMHRGINENRIEMKYLGEFGPILTDVVCSTYGILGTYKAYVESKATSGTDQNGYLVIDGLNQSVTIYVISSK